MNPLTLALIALRGLSTLFALQGKSKEGDALGLVATGLEAGLNVDAHMAAVAEALKAGQAADWSGVADRIAADTALLNG